MSSKEIQLIEECIKQIHDVEVVRAIKNDIAGWINYVHYETFNIWWDNYEDKNEIFKQYDEKICMIIKNKNRAKRIVDTDALDIKKWMSIATEKELIEFIEEIVLCESDCCLTYDQIEKWGELIFNLKGHLAMLTGHYSVKWDEEGNCVSVSSI